MNGLLFANVAATAAICAIFLLRRILRNRFFARFFVLLWLLVIFRLLLPFEFSSGISFYSPVQPPENVFSESTGETFFSPGIIYPEILPEGNSESPEKDSAKISSGEFLLCIWLSGAVFTGGFFVLKHRFSVKKILSDCAPFEDVPEEFSGGKTRFFKSKTLCSPLSFGILRPTVVIPESTGEKQLPFVLLHEQTHLENRDPALKALALCALSLNWFNPAVWFMVKFFDRDLELFCDERVLKTLGNEKALAYANTILDFAERESLSLSFFSASSLCERITSIMKNKNKKSRVLAATAIFSAVVLLMTACGTAPAPEERKPISAGKLSAENSPAEEIDSALQEMVESELEKGSGDFMDINSGTVVGEIPGLAEELQGFYGENSTNNSAAESDSGIKLAFPVEEGWVSDGFGGFRNHSGIDIASETGKGTKILAAADGIVITAEYDAVYGNYMVIDHGNGIFTLYAHCDEFFAEANRQVFAGEPIASMGVSGNATGPCLHFEIQVNGESLDPMDYILH